MKESDKLRLLIRKIVREEISMAMDNVISEIKSAKVPDKNVTYEKSPKKTNKLKKKQYVKDSLLNDLLNETYEGGEWKTINNSGFTTQNMNDIMQHKYSDTSKETISGDEMVASMGVRPDAVGDGIKDVLGRDYRGLMKAINKKKGK